MLLTARSGGHAGRPVPRDVLPVLPRLSKRPMWQAMTTMSPAASEPGPAPTSRDGVGREHVDVLVSGAGAAGLAATIALARAGFFPSSARGKSDTAPNGRTVALFEGSLRYLRAIGAWARLEPIAAPIRAIRNDRRHRHAPPRGTADARRNGDRPRRTRRQCRERQARRRPACRGRDIAEPCG